MVRRIVFILIIFHQSLQAQVAWDTNTYAYNWLPSSILSVPPEEQISDRDKRETKYNKDLVENIFNRIEYLLTDSFADFYTKSKLSSIKNGILSSDKVWVDQRSEAVFDIQYGNYVNEGFGLKSVRVYNHLFVDTQKRKILPVSRISFTY